MSNSQYSFKELSHEDLIKFALNQPRDLEHNEYSQLVRELGIRLRIFKRCMDKF